MGFLLWFLFDVVFSSVLELLFEITKSFDSDRELRTAAVVWFVLLGFGGGLLTGVVAPSRFLEPGPVPGLSLVVVPFALGVVMQVWGALSARRESEASHLASWYGGAALGLGLAVGRFVVLAFLRDLKAV